MQTAPWGPPCPVQTGPVACQSASVIKQQDRSDWSKTARLICRGYEVKPNFSVLGLDTRIAQQCRHGNDCPGQILSSSTLTGFLVRALVRMQEHLKTCYRDCVQQHLVSGRK